jgi:hypothetical protein
LLLDDSSAWAVGKQLFNLESNDLEIVALLTRLQQTRTTTMRSTAARRETFRWWLCRHATALPVLKSAVPLKSFNASSSRASSSRAALGFLVLLSLSLLSGCRGRAHEDVYQAKLANQIRVLEDQLYEADYHNRVLRDKLRQAEDAARRHDGGPIPSSSQEARSSQETSSSQETLNGGARTNRDHDVRREDPGSGRADPGTGRTADDYELLDLDKPDPGQPSEDGSKEEAPEVEKPGKRDRETDSQPLPEPLTDPSSMPQPPSDDTPDTPPIPVPDPSNSDPTLDEPSGADPQPELPQPPTEKELKSPPERIELPPGSKILEFEDAAEAENLPVPDHLEIHDGLSGGYQFDEDQDIDGLFLVVTVADEAGRLVPLDGFEVDAQLTVVVLDPDDETAESPIGRWEFSPKQVREFVKSSPVDGIHVPLKWKEKLPRGDDVIVHVRMAAAEEEMRCQGRLKLAESVAMSNWLPRG